MGKTGTAACRGGVWLQVRIEVVSLLSCCCKTNNAHMFFLSQTYDTGNKAITVVREFWQFNCTTSQRRVRICCTSARGHSCVPNGCIPAARVSQPRGVGHFCVGSHMQRGHFRPTQGREFLTPSPTTEVFKSRSSRKSKVSKPFRLSQQRS